MLAEAVGLRDGAQIGAIDMIALSSPSKLQSNHLNLY
jgi:hypothetical protein